MINRYCSRKPLGTQNRLPEGQASDHGSVTARHLFGKGFDAAGNQLLMADRNAQSLRPVIVHLGEFEVSQRSATSMPIRRVSTSRIASSLFLHRAGDLASIENGAPVAACSDVSVYATVEAAQVVPLRK